MVAVRPLVPCMVRRSRGLVISRGPVAAPSVEAEGSRAGSGIVIQGLRLMLRPAAGGSSQRAVIKRLWGLRPILNSGMHRPMVRIVARIVRVVPWRRGLVVCARVLLRRESRGGGVVGLVSGPAGVTPRCGMPVSFASQHILPHCRLHSLRRKVVAALESPVHSRVAASPAAMNRWRRRPVVLEGPRLAGLRIAVCVVRPGLVTAIGRLLVVRVIALVGGLYRVVLGPLGRPVLLRRRICPPRCRAELGARFPPGHVI